MKNVKQSVSKALRSRLIWGLAVVGLAAVAACELFGYQMWDALRTLTGEGFKNTRRPPPIEREHAGMVIMHGGNKLEDMEGRLHDWKGVSGQ